VPTIALHADDQRLIGFILIAGTDSLVDGPVVRDCVILATPTDAVLLDEPLLVAIEPWLNDERFAHVVARGDRITVHVTLGVEDKLVLDVDLACTGRWHLDPAAAQSGYCRLAALGER
jgi:hypothetical protein